VSGMAGAAEAAGSGVMPFIMGQNAG
jgi:hypothetical protein